MFVIYFGNEVVFETEDREYAYNHCANLNEAYHTNSYHVEFESRR